MSTRSMYSERKPVYLPRGRATPDDDRVYDAEAVEFMNAMQREKERLGVTELSAAQMLTVARRLGYRKVAPTAELPRFRRKTPVE